MLVMVFSQVCIQRRCPMAKIELGKPFEKDGIIHVVYMNSHPVFYAKKRSSAYRYLYGKFITRVGSGMRSYSQFCRDLNSNKVFGCIDVIGTDFKVFARQIYK